MAKPMKYHPHDSVLFCTFSIEEGLLLLSNPLCLAIIKSCLAAAQLLYPVTICHLLVQATHLHMILVVKNPDHIPSFIRHFKTESAHMLNRILGRRKRTIWCDGYDSPMVLTLRRALVALAYLYANPAKDNLVPTIENYPGFSTWKMFRSGILTEIYTRLRRFQFLPLGPKQHNLKSYQQEAHRLTRKSSEALPFTIEPNAWMEAFKITDPAQQQRINARLLERISHLEQRAATKRLKEKKSLIGRTRLIAQPLSLSYTPKRSGKRMWCLADKRSLRIAFITFFKKLMATARSVRERWRQGDISVRYPPGLFPPSMPKLANVFRA
jgi:hypothetical protein